MSQQVGVGITSSSDPNAIDVAGSLVPWQNAEGAIIQALLQGIQINDPDTGVGANVTSQGAVQVDGSAVTQPVSHAALAQLLFDTASNLKVTSRGFGTSGYAAVPTNGLITAPVAIGTLPAGTRQVEFTLKSTDSVQFVIAQSNPGDVTGTPNVISPVIWGTNSVSSNPITYTVHVDGSNGWNVYMVATDGSPQWRAL